MEKHIKDGSLPTAEEILAKRIVVFPSDENMSDEAIKRNVIAAMKEYGNNIREAALKAAAGEARTDLNGCCKEQEFDCSAQIDKDSILNAYPKDNIK